MESNEAKSTSPRLLLALASILIAGLLIFLFLPRNAGVYRAVPAQTSLVLECAGLLRVKVLADKTPDLRWREVLHSQVFQRCFQDTDAALQLLKHEPSMFRAFAKNKALVAFSLNPADSLHALFALELEEDFNLEKLLKTNRLTPKYFSHQFHGNEIFNVHLSKTERLEIAALGNLLLFSRRATLVEDALAQLENARNWWTDRPYFKDLPDAPLRLHLRPAALAEQCRNQMNSRWRGLPDLLARNIEWLGLSWNGKELAAMSETKGFIGGLANWGETPSQEIFNILPDNTAFLARAGFGNVPDFFRRLSEGRTSDFERYVLPWVGTEAALAITEPLSPALLGDRLLLLAVRDSTEAVSSLRAFSKDRGSLPRASGQYQMFEILGFQNASLLKPILGDDEGFRNPVCVLIGGFAVFASDRSSLEIFLDKYLVNQTLSANIDFLQLRQKHPQKGQASFALNTAYLPALLQNISGVKGENSFAQLGFVSAELHFQFGKKAGVDLASQALSQPPVETDVLWKAVLSSPAATQPYLVDQPEGKTVALIQDLKNNLCCLDAQNGWLLWSKPLPGRILSDIGGIDFYGNGTKCYTFGTARAIFTLDENGRDVPGFPLNLPASATNGATVVDFDKNTKFHYFVACDNGKVYGFGHLGKPLDGWNGRNSNGSVRRPILHFQHKGKDYLASLTESGLLSVFGRDGSMRFPPLQLEGKFDQLLQIDASSPAPQIYCANTAGKIFACDLQGHISAMQVGKPSSLAAFGQLTGNARFEWAILDGKILTVGTWGGESGETLFSTQFPEKQHLVFFAKNNHIGTVDMRGRRVWLLDSKGASLAGFPLGGSTVFDIARVNSVDMLVVGNGNGILAYRIKW